MAAGKSVQTVALHGEINVLLLIRAAMCSRLGDRRSNAAFVYSVSCFCKREDNFNAVENVFFFFFYFSYLLDLMSAVK